MGAPAGGMSRAEWGGGRQTHSSPLSFELHPGLRSVVLAGLGLCSGESATFSFASGGYLLTVAVPYNSKLLFFH